MADRDLSGRTLGDFVLREKIGEGGWGAVYRSEQPLLKREVVVKGHGGRIRRRGRSKANSSHPRRCRSTSIRTATTRTMNRFLRFGAPQRPAPARYRSAMKVKSERARGGA
jgi:hypothetical protein